MWSFVVGTDERWMLMFIVPCCWNRKSGAFNEGRRLHAPQDDWAITDSQMTQ